MKSTLTLIVAASLGAATASADELGFDVRTAYMGGAGVAGQRADAGIPLNPANLALPQDGERWGLTIPVIGGELFDPDNLRGQIDNIQNANLGQVQSDISTLQSESNNDPAALNNPAMPNPAMQNLGQFAGQLATALTNASGSQAVLDAEAGTGLAVPGKQLGWGLDLKTSAQVVATPNISAQDIDLLQQMSAVFSKGYVTPLDHAEYPQVLELSGAPNSYNPTSSATIVGLVSTEAGVSLAHQIALSGKDQALALGFTPKIMQLQTYDYTSVFSSTNGFSTSDIRHYKTDDQMANFDAGLTYEANSSWRLAATVTNGIGKTLTTAEGHQVDLSPQYAAGLAYKSPFFSWSLDDDLNPQKGLGFNTNSQFVATGVELNAWNAIRVGFGYRHNLLETAQGDQATAGLSTSLLGLNAGLALAEGRHDTSVVAQLSLEY